MDAVRVMCLRHGESTDNAAGVLSGRPPGAPLSVLGRAQAERAVPVLRRERVVAVYSSSARRAAQTAGIAAAGLGVPTAQAPGLEEYGLGECEGATDSAALTRCVSVMRGWIVAGDLDARLPAGESGRQVADRFVGALRGIADRHRGQTVAVVSHVGTLTIGLMALCAGLGPEQVWGAILPHATPFAVDFDGSTWRCQQWPGVRPDRPVPA